MKYQIGDTVITKKNHVCGSDQWQVLRVGAEVKVKCIKCGREVMMMKTDFDKRVKSVLMTKSTAL
ncbi:MAG: hypothetical protein A2Y45_02085 [Tenericutes bacterium GWC2_34_14]|nr:MAG: hypothetical protein A2Y45_02085 [Tenericutes bacterium GWC2_34_14]OHE33034.1 MAG: hypothetical protein A2012_10145 [Tenericutes bacterium GWE2_34_108]OHE36000.1 MAG: hypothetical protein A2Y46_06265 [Tenericutes bacterium GWF1_35_14]OHE39223.1 MAG: hypothetical protein A2Y44_05625 [Tenericutes bacterium GWF2_35_184]OHE42429.1 MAG: hypothetical protein A3K26_09315 [Tenericutes bacterium RIFOXYA12_FULL_35_10]OHE44499.1 MAG: hypothetical protein A2221_01460 [Tenericutes bacterium RIFOXYA